MEASHEQLEALRRVRGLELAQLRQDLLRAAHLVDDLEGVHPLVQLGERDLADHAHDIERDPVLDAEVLPGDERGRVAEVLGIGALALAPRRARVGQPVVVARVAVDGGADRAQLLEALPEAVGDAVDGAWLRHSVFSPCRCSGTPAASGYRCLPSTAAVRRGRIGEAREAGQNRPSCSARRSTAGSSPRYGSRSARSSGSRASHARRCGHRTRCQFAAAIVSRSTGEDSSL